MPSLSLNVVPQPRFRELRARLPHGPHLADGWIDYRRRRGATQSYVVVREGAQEIGVGVLHVERSRRAFWRRPRAVLDRMPWLLPGVTASAEELLRALREHARAVGFAALDLSSYDGPSPPADLRGAGFEAVQDRYEFTIDLEGDDDSRLAAMKGSHRRKLRKAEAAGVVVRDETDRTPWTLLDSLQEHTQERRAERGESMQRPGLDQLRALEQSLRPRGEGLFLVGRKDDTPVSAALVGCAGGGSYYLLGGTDSVGLALNAATCVLTEAARAARTRGARWLNLGGVPVGAALPEALEHGLYRFKEGFGADRRDCQSGTWRRDSSRRGSG